jgi:hypothetical protein
MMIADYLSRSYEADIPEKKTYKDVHHPRNNLIRAPDNLPQGLTIAELNEFVKPYVEQIRARMANETPERPFTGTGYVQALFADSPEQIVDMVCKQEPSQRFINALEPYLEALKGDNRKRKSVSFAPYVRVKPFDKNQTLQGDKSYAGRLLLITLDRTGFSIDTVKELQRADSYLAPIIQKFEEKGQLDGWIMKKGVLMKIVKDVANMELPVLALPRCLVHPILTYYHGSFPSHGSHAGKGKISSLVRTYYWWRKLEVDVKEFCRSCIICSYMQNSALRKVNTQDRYITERPNERVFIDLISGLPRSGSGKKVILACYDDFTRFGQAYALPNAEAETVANAFLHGWMQVFGTPDSIHSDNGRNVDGHLMNRICRICSIRKTSTPNYHAKSDSAEPFIKSIAHLLRSEASGTSGKWWCSMLPMCVVAYNHTPHSISRIEPARLMMGHLVSQRYVPVIGLDSPIINTEFLAAIRRSQQILWQVVLMNKELKERHRKDQPPVYHPFEVGQLVMVKYKNPKDAHMSKLASKWKGPYFIMKSYVASLLVYPMSLASQEILDKKGNISQIMRLKGSIVSVEDCKKYRGPVPPVPRIDRELIRNFFKDLGLLRSKAGQDIRPSTFADVDEELALLDRVANAGLDSDVDFSSSEDDDESAYGTPPETFDNVRGLERGYEYGQYNTRSTRPATPSFIDVDAEDLGFESDHFGNPESDSDSENTWANNTQPWYDSAREDSESDSESEAEVELLGRTRAETLRLRLARDEQAANALPVVDINSVDRQEQTADQRRVDRRSVADEFLVAFNDRERTTDQDAAIERVRDIMS